MAVFADGHLDFGQLRASQAVASPLLAASCFLLAYRFNHRRNRLGCRLQQAGVAGAHDDLCREALPVIFRIGADAGFGMRLLDGGQRCADIAFAVGRTHRLRHDLCAGAQGRHDIVEHGLKNLRHARHDIDIADDEAGSDGNGVGDMSSTFRHTRHALASLGEFHLTDAIHVAQEAQRLGIVFAGQAECRRDRVRGDVVMGRADAARGKDIIITAAQRVQRLDNRFLLVGDDADFLEVNAGHGEHIREVADILVLGAAGRQFVADGEHGGSHDGGGGGGIGHGCTRHLFCQTLALRPGNAKRFWQNVFCKWLTLRFSVHSW